MDIELTSTKQKKQYMQFCKIHDLKLLFNEQQVNGYKIELNKGNTLEITCFINGYLLVSQAESVIDYKMNGIIQHRIIKAGHYIWLMLEEISLLKQVTQLANFILLQLK